MRTVDPATGMLVREYVEHTEDDVAARLERAGDAFRAWSARPVAGRTALLRSLAGVLRAGLSGHAALMTAEMGKPIAQAEAEVEKCAVTCDWFADHATALLEPEPAGTEAAASYIRFDPLGVVLAVMPWNFPFWQVIRCAAPALAAGDTVVLKHASNVPGCALALEEAFEKAGFPEGAFTTLLVPSRTVGEIIAHPAVRAVSLTGSEAAGRQVASPPSASSSRSRSPHASRTPWSSAWRRCAWATRATAPCRWARSPAPTSWRSWRTRCNAPWRQAPCCAWADGGSRGRVASSLPPSSPASSPAWRPSTRRPSARSRR